MKRTVDFIEEGKSFLLEGFNLGDEALDKIGRIYRLRKNSRVKSVTINCHYGDVGESYFGMSVKFKRPIKESEIVKMLEGQRIGERGFDFDLENPCTAYLDILHNCNGFSYLFSVGFSPVEED